MSLRSKKQFLSTSLRRVTPARLCNILVVWGSLITTSITFGATAHAQNATDAPLPTTAQDITTIPNPAAAPSPDTLSVPAQGPTLPSEVSKSSNTSSHPGAAEVIDVYRLGHKHSKDKESRSSAGIGDILVVEVRGLRSLANKAKCLDEQGRSVKDCQEKEIALFLDGRKINGIFPESGAPRPENGTLQFHIQRSIENDEAWADLLGAPPLGAHFFRRPTEISVGLEDGYPEATMVEARDFSLTRIRKIRFWACAISLLFLICLFFMLVNRSDILRDSGPTPTGTDIRGKDKRKPFSLARCQMAFWFFLVISSFLFIWQITGAYDIITASVLGLIGIGAGTALGAAVIDVGKREDISSQLASLKAEKLVLDDDIIALDTQISSTLPPTNLAELQQTRSAKQARLNLIDTQITILTAASEPKESQGFLNDILTDATGVSFHRFQMATWTIVLGIIFIYSVWSRLSMPDFSATLLALLGISAGTYIGFKIPEKQS